MGDYTFCPDHAWLRMKTKKNWYAHVYFTIIKTVYGMYHSLKILKHLPEGTTIGDYTGRIGFNTTFSFSLALRK